MLPSACASCFPPLAEGQSGRLGRRLYNRLTLHRQTTNHGLSARVPRDSPEERYDSRSRRGAAGHSRLLAVG